MQVKRENTIGQLIKQKRVTIPLTLEELSNNSSVSSSHLGRIERGERFPSAHVLHKIAEPLGFEVEELFMLAGFLSETQMDKKDATNGVYNVKKLDPFVANALAQEPVEIQRATIGILSLFKVIAKANK